jgi:DNA-binding response OmpR family regulator
MLNVLLIDDFPDSCLQITSAISDSCQVTIETDPQKALGREDLDQYSAYLVDINMPGIRGDKVIESLRKKVSRPAPFCLMTGANFDESIEKCHSYLVDEFFDKSGSPVEIKSRFSAVLKRTKVMYRLIEHGPITVNLTTALVCINGENFECTSTEYRLICNLLSVLSEYDYAPRKEFIKSLWGDTFVEEKTLSTHLSNLNKRLKDYGIKVKTKRFKGLYLSC